MPLAVAFADLALGHRPQASQMMETAVQGDNAMHDVTIRKAHENIHAGMTRTISHSGRGVSGRTNPMGGRLRELTHAGMTDKRIHSETGVSSQTIQMSGRLRAATPAETRDRRSHSGINDLDRPHSIRTNSFGVAIFKLYPVNTRPVERRDGTKTCRAQDPDGEIQSLR